MQHYTRPKAHRQKKKEIHEEVETPQKCGNAVCAVATVTEADNCPKCSHLYDFGVGYSGCHCRVCWKSRKL